MTIKPLTKFSLYGFLKNQRYFEPFIMLAFISKGFSFFQIGILIGFREICANIMEIPTGAIADALGRKRTMIASHIGYIIAFLLLGYAREYYWFFPGMFAFSVGEAFRTGTHKAIIFQWMKKQGITDQKTKIYGHTRFYSKMGSAVSAWIAAGFLLWLDDYRWVFYLSAIPIFFNIINFISYPDYVDGDAKKSASAGEVFQHIVLGLRICAFKKKLRQLLVESSTFEGIYKSTKDYLQPVIEAFVISLPVLGNFSDKRRAIVLIAIIYSILHILSAKASKSASRFENKFKTTSGALNALWITLVVMFAVMLCGLKVNPILSIISFIILAVIQNFWRPIMISQVADQAKQKYMATVLSTESQCKNLFTAILAPIVGYFADKLTDDCKFVPVALVGLVLGSLVLVSKLAKR